jgi:NitT/TauT family transport system substrate-binding protein
MDSGVPLSRALGRGEVDFTANYALAHVVAIDAGEPITIVGGEHLGCFELFASGGIRSVTDLKGKNVGVPSLGSSPHLFLSAIVAYVGLDPLKDIHWIVTSSIKPMELYADGKIDAFLGFPPEPQHLRAHNIGKVILNSALDRPWSQYLCCMLAAHRDFVRRHPVATKRALRAIIKATDFCVNASPNRWSTAISPLNTTMRCRCSRKSRTESGASSIPRTQSDSIRCGCAKRA